MKLPNSIVRRLSRICFKSKETLLRHVRGLFASHQYSAPIKRAKRHAALRQRECMNAAKENLHRVHRECCLQAYLVKHELVAMNRGHNTLSGIPA